MARETKKALRGAVSPTSQHAAEQAERDRDVLDMRVAGATLQQIGDRYFSGDRSNARRSLLRILKQHVGEGVEQLRAVENERLDAMHAALWDAVVTERDLDAAKVILQTMDRRARLNGLDVKTDTTSGSLTVLVDPGLTTGRMVDAEMIVDDVDTTAGDD